MKIYLSLILLILVIHLHGQDAIYNAAEIHHPVISKNGMVASQHTIATEVGIEILKKGGNAFDAAVAVGFTLAVVLPRAGNIGGGGFMVYHTSDDLQTYAVDYREMAPATAHRDMYLDDNHEIDSELFEQSYQSVGVPGTVAGLVHVLEKHGTMPLAEIMEPAIRLARIGFPISQNLAELLITFEKRLKRCDATAKVFYPSHGYYTHGDTLKQVDLSNSLSEIALHGKDAFYKGKLAKKITAGIQAQSGILTLDDFSNYQINETPPVMGSYRGYTIASMPPPSSGGVHLIQMLNILEHFNLAMMGHNSAVTIHLMAEAMRYAYADRSVHLGDPAFWDVPVDGIISKKYAHQLSEKISLDKASSSKEVRAGNPQDYESNETTHFSIADRYGNVVSNTYTLNFSFGTGLMIDGTGILLNNEMGDFSAKPGSSNAYDLIGAEANKIEAGKRPLSSMTPTIVFKENKPYLITGSPGGSRIITSVLQVILNVIDHKMNIADATHAQRIHHQWLPDLLYYDGVLNKDTELLLKEKGHNIKSRNAMGSTQSILIQNNLFYGASDPRRPDAKTIGY